MEKENTYLANFYRNRKTSDNFLSCRHVELEHFITMKYISKYIKSKDNVLEIGSGVRSYVPELLNKCKNITAFDLFEENLNLVKDKTNNSNMVEFTLGNIVDLSKIKDNTFDIVLAWPMSHLFSNEEREKAVSELTRVCKPNGYIFVNFLTNVSILYRYGLIKSNLIDCLGKFENNGQFKQNEKDVFSTYFAKDFDKLFENNSLTKLHSIATDGFFEILKEKTNTLSEQEFELIKKWQLAVCELKEINGMSSHVLNIYKKSKNC